MGGSNEVSPHTQHREVGKNYFLNREKGFINNVFETTPQLWHVRGDKMYYFIFIVGPPLEFRKFDFFSLFGEKQKMQLWAKSFLSFFLVISRMVALRFLCAPPLLASLCHSCCKAIFVVLVASPFLGWKLFSSLDLSHFWRYEYWGEWLPCVFVVLNYYYLTSIILVARSYISFLLQGHFRRGFSSHP